MMDADEDGDSNHTDKTQTNQNQTLSGPRGAVQGQDCLVTP